MAEDESKGSLRVGQYGYSLDTIMDGKQGFCYFDGKRAKVKAGGAIRKWAEVILITTVPEPTVIETWSVFPLSYEKTGGAGAYTTVGEDSPLPVTPNSKAVLWVQEDITSSGNTLLKTPETGKKLRVVYFSLSNEDAGVADVGLRFKTDGDTIHYFSLPADGGTVNANLSGVPWEGAVDEALYAYALAAYTAVHVTIGYVEV